MHLELNYININRIAFFILLLILYYYMKPHHGKFFLSALRSALLILGSFILYDLLNEMILIWDEIFLHKKEHHIYYRRIYQYLGVFLIDLVILYFVFYLFKIQLT